jgi:hypothetical protein
MRTAICCLFLTAFVLTGCGSDVPQRELNLVPVSGTVLLDSKPLEGAIVSFVPLPGTADAEYATGTTNAEGKYTLSVNAVGEGAVPGEYRVVISKFAQPDGTPVPPDTAPADVGAVETIPARYSGVDNETLRMTVPAAGSSSADFELKTR